MAGIRLAGGLEAIEAPNSLIRLGWCVRVSGKYLMLPCRPPFRSRYRIAQLTPGSTTLFFKATQPLIVISVVRWSFYCAYTLTNVVSKRSRSLVAAGRRLSQRCAYILWLHQKMAGKLGRCRQHSTPF